MGLTFPRVTGGWRSDAIVRRGILASGRPKSWETHMKLPPDQLERLALHSAFGLHLVVKWMATRSDVDPQIRDRLSAHLAALDGVLSTNGHDWIREEMEKTEAELHSPAG